MYPLLSPQWKDPVKWWKQLATAKGRKDYGWSHLAARYWPTRVDAKCHQDPSLGVAHLLIGGDEREVAPGWNVWFLIEVGPVPGSKPRTALV